MWKTLSVLVFVAGVGPVLAQVDNRSRTQPNPNQTNPYGADWAKPGGTTGSYIYRDPRLTDPNGGKPAQRDKRCNPPLMYDPASGVCR